MHNEWDEVEHGLISNVTGIEPQLTPCARLMYIDDSFPTFTTPETMFPGPLRDSMECDIELVSTTQANYKLQDRR